MQMLTVHECKSNTTYYPSFTKYPVALSALGSSIMCHSSYAICISAVITFVDASPPRGDRQFYMKFHELQGGNPIPYTIYASEEKVVAVVSVDIFLLSLNICIHRRQVFLSNAFLTNILLASLRKRNSHVFCLICM